VIDVRGLCGYDGGMTRRKLLQRALAAPVLGIIPVAGPQPGSVEWITKAMSAGRMSVLERCSRNAVLLSGWREYYAAAIPAGGLV
jgi:hypothetical protein